MDEIIKLMSGLKSKVSSSVKRKVREIITLATDYSYLGASFTFNADEDLDSEVNRILIELSDEILAEIDMRAAKAVVESGNEDDINAIFAYIHRDIEGKTATYRIDSYSSHLKFLLEGYIAVGLADKWTKGDFITSLASFLTNPMGFAKYKDAFGTNDFIFTENGQPHFGVGVPINPIEGMTLVGGYMIDEAFQHGRLLGFRKDANIIGYRVKRNSTYDCPVCDELCVGIHPLDEEVLPAHPRCVCSMIPVYSTEIQ